MSASPFATCSAFTRVLHSDSFRGVELQGGVLGVPESETRFQGLDRCRGGAVLHGEVGVEPVRFPVEFLERVGVADVLLGDRVQERLVEVVLGASPGGHGDVDGVVVLLIVPRLSSENCSHIK